MGLFSSKQDQVEAEAATGARRSRRVKVPAGDRPLDPLDPLEMQKRRARRRLIGAIALVAGAVVLLPMVFDSEPRSGVDDLAVEIPGQETPFNPNIPSPSSVPAQVPGAVAPAPAQSVLVPGAPAAPGPIGAPAPPLVSSTAPAPQTAQVQPAESSAPAKAKTDAKTDAKAAAQKPQAPVTAKGDDPRALAALEGKTLAPTLDTNSGSETFAVQVGAFSSAEKVKDVRDKLQAAGLKPYTENLSTPQGPRTRVRVGPFATHDAAEKARERVNGLGLDASVVSL
jgi:DedD protein